jgi:hypothetical protein
MANWRGIAGFDKQKSEIVINQDLIVLKISLSCVILMSIVLTG